MNEYIFTFMTSQKEANNFVSIKAKNSSEARKQMVAKFGTAWAFQYDPPNAKEKAGVNMFNLKELKL